MPADAAPAAPLSVAGFARRMARLGPFEARPALVAAVSGGADSLALAWLGAEWARQQGGDLVALTVDHGLRPEAGAEARQVAAWLGARGIRHHTLRWRGAKPVANIQATARAARYRLLAQWCARAGRLHLLLGHHRADQAETLVLRLGRGSGADGLAAMAPVIEHAAVRLLRPFLADPPARLAATLVALGQPWIEDPTNRDPAFARVRVRAAARALARVGLDERRLADTALRMGRVRATLEGETAALLARAVRLHPAGFAALEGGTLAAAPEELGLRALARVVRTIGGGAYPPRLERLERAYAAIVGRAPARTLAGCRILPPTRLSGGRVLVVRETAAMAPACVVAPGTRIAWDGRFALSVGGDAGAGLSVGGLGRAGWAALAHTAPALRDRPIPPPVRPTLLALWRGGRVVCVPHLGYPAHDSPVRAVLFRPAEPLAGARFAVV